ncbi:MAG: hypothetical protein RLZZ501_624, partial [Pseudomonadota bacterium]
MQSGAKDTQLAKNRPVLPPCEAAFRRIASNGLLRDVLRQQGP